MRCLQVFAVWMLWSCAEKPKEPSLSSLAPPPLPTLESPTPKEDIEPSLLDSEQAAPSPKLWGEPLPSFARKLEIDEEGKVSAEGQPVNLTSQQTLERFKKGKAWLIVSKGEVYMAMLSPLLAALSDSGADVWIQSVEGPVAFRVDLKDEPAFQKWLADVVPGRVRVIQRADGLELSTIMGKVVGPDPNGPSVPNRNGRLDIETARIGLKKLRERFSTAEELGFVPSSGTELRHVAWAMSANYRDMEKPYFEKMFLVYRRLTDAPQAQNEGAPSKGSKAPSSGP